MDEWMDGWPDGWDITKVYYVTHDPAWHSLQQFHVKWGNFLFLALKNIEKHQYLQRLVICKQSLKRGTNLLDFSFYQEFLRETFVQLIMFVSKFKVCSSCSSHYPECIDCTFVQLFSGEAKRSPSLLEKQNLQKK